MERNDPPDDAAGEPTLPAGEPIDDTLRRLEDRLDRASHAAERLIAEAAAKAATSAPAASSPDPPRPPPAGWQAPHEPSDAGRRPTLDAELLTQVLHSLRELIPPDLQHRLAEALREVLLAVRALIDWYLERAEHQRSAPIEVQDIPIA